MQRGGILNSHIAKVVADLGHTDRICIADCGLPVPDDVLKIDLAVDFGQPSYKEVLDMILANVCCESIIIASEMKIENKDVYDYTMAAIEPLGCKVDMYMHEDLKRITADCKCVIRTGEDTPYANVILQSGCIFSGEERG